MSWRKASIYRLMRSLKESARRFFPRRTKAHTICSGPLKGSLIYTSWHDYPGAVLGTTERPLLAWFADHVKDGETWLDVGAHFGYTAIALSRLVGNSGGVYAFEPVHSTATALTQTRDANKLDQLRVVPFALSDNRCECVLRIPATRGMADSTLGGSNTHETVSAIALDVLWPKLVGKGMPIHGIKIDVQGMELQVLAGMRGILAEWGPKLVVEFHAGVNRLTVLALLSSTGYATSPEPVDPAHKGAQLIDDHSYVFRPKFPICTS